MTMAVRWPCLGCKHEVHIHRAGRTGWACGITGCECKNNPLGLEAKQRSGPLEGGVGYGPDIGETSKERKAQLRRKASIIAFVLIFGMIVSGITIRHYTKGSGPQCDEAADYWLTKASGSEGAERAEAQRQAEIYLLAEQQGHTCKAWKKPGAA